MLADSARYARCVLTPLACTAVTRLEEATALPYMGTCSSTSESFAKNAIGRRNRQRRILSRCCRNPRSSSVRC